MNVAALYTELGKELAELSRTSAGGPAFPQRVCADPPKWRTQFRKMKPSSPSVWLGKSTERLIYLAADGLAALTVTNALFSRNEERFQLLSVGNEKPCARSGKLHPQNALLLKNNL